MWWKECDTYLTNTQRQGRTNPIVIEAQVTHHMVQGWRDMMGQWHDQLVTMELVLSWYKMWHCVGLVVQSLLYSTTQQLHNNRPLLRLNMLMLNSWNSQSASGLDTITRLAPRRSGEDYPSGQQVVITNLSSVWLRTNLLQFRSMTWFSPIFLWPRSSRLLEWMTICGCKPSSTMKSWRGSGDKN